MPLRLDARGLRPPPAPIPAARHSLTSPTLFTHSFVYLASTHFTCSRNPTIKKLINEPLIYSFIYSFFLFFLLSLASFIKSFSLIACLLIRSPSPSLTPLKYRLKQKQGRSHKAPPNTLMSRKYTFQVFHSILKTLLFREAFPVHTQIHGCYGTRRKSYFTSIVCSG